MTPTELVSQIVGPLNVSSLYYVEDIERRRSAHAAELARVEALIRAAMTLPPEVKAAVEELTASHVKERAAAKAIATKITADASADFEVALRRFNRAVDRHLPTLLAHLGETK